jgi:hypothetical protein
VNEESLESLPDSAINVAGNYIALRDDILSGSSTVPDFDPPCASRNGWTMFLHLRRA